MSPLGIDVRIWEVYEEIRISDASLNVESGGTSVSTYEFSFLKKNAVTGVALKSLALPRTRVGVTNLE